MVQGAMVLMKGVRCGHKLLGRTYTTFLLSLSREINNTMPILSLERRPCFGIKDWGILEKRAFEHYMVKVWLKVCLIALSILIFVNIAYMVNKIKIHVGT
jgi:hypothetical protein